MKNALHFKAKAQNAKQGGIVKMKKLFTKWLSALLIAALLLPCVAVAEGEFSGGGELTFDNEPPVLDAANAQAVDASTIQTDLNVENDNDEVLSNAVDPVVLETEDVELNGDELTVEAMETTYWFMVKDELYQEQTAGDGETFVKPADPSAPEGSVFVGWYLEDGTQLFVDGAEEISNADEARRFINVLARFETNFDDEDEKMGTPRDDDAAADVEGSDVSEDDTSTDVEGSDVSEDDTTTDVEGSDVSEDDTTTDVEGSDVSEDDTTTDVEGSDVSEDDTTTDVEGSGECGDGDAATDVSVGDAPIDAESDPVEATDCGNDAPEIETQGIVNAGSVEGKEAAEGMNNEDRPDVGSEEDANGEANPDEEGNAAPNEDGEVSPDDAADTAESPADGDNTDEVLPVRVAFETVPTEAAVRVFGLSVSDGEDNSVEIPSEEDGSYALLPGDYTYSAMAEGYVPVEAVPFTVDASGEPLEINIELEPEEAAVEPVCVIFNAVPETAAITVYAVQHEALHEKDDAAESISPQEDGSFLLLPGEYAYSATAEGYIPAEAVPFTVDEEALTISVALDPLVEEPVAFDQSSELYGVVVRVQADPGVFPAGAELCVNRVPVMKRREADAAIEEVRDEGVNVAVSYTFDIKVIDSETGDELQPAEGQNVNVSFALAEVADENLEIQVYHVTEEAGELSAEALDIISPETREEATATVETSGFSIYTVEFHYNRLEYVLQGDSSVALSEILNAVGLGGEVSAVEISNTELFSASNEGGEWVVYAHQAFESTEWMKVTINGVVYEITVTDDREEPQGVSVTFHANGGWYGDERDTEHIENRSPGESMFMLEGYLIPENTEGRVFRGWATSANGEVVYTWSDDDDKENWTVAEGGGEFYAVWDDGVIVRFHAGEDGTYRDDDGREYDERVAVWMPGEWHNLLEEDWLRPDMDEGKRLMGWKDSEGDDGNVIAWDGEDEEGRYLGDWQVPKEAKPGETEYDFYAIIETGVIVRFHAGEDGTYRDDRGREYDTQVAVWMPGEGHNLLEEDWLYPDMDEGKRLMGWKDSEGDDGNVIAWDGEDEEGRYLGDWQVPKEAKPGETSFDFYAYNEELVTIYEWAYDNRTVTAKRYWNITNAPEETETVDTNGIVTKEATCVDKGETTYTATFTSSSFTTQTKVVKDVDIVAANHDWGTPTYTWSADNSTVTAKCVCANDPTHIQVETVDATSAVTTSATCTAKGKTTYTAVFTNTAFASQTKVVENIDALGHNWGAWTKVSDATTSSPEQQRRICARCNAVETRSVGDKLPTPPAVVESPQVISPSITIPKVPASVKAKAAKNGKVTVSWKAIKKSKKTKALLTQIKWIELQYSTDPTFATNVNTKNIGKKKTKVTLKLQKKTVYYIRVRYIDGAGGVSNWSAVKKVKTKK